MREIGAMWQIGILTGKPCTSLLKNGSFLAFSHYKNKERVLTWNCTFLYLSSGLQKWLSTAIYSINRGSDLLWLEIQEAPQNGQNVHTFQVRTIVCHIVLVSRACGVQSPSL